jgi:hypothetical protein
MASDKGHCSSLTVFFSATSRFNSVVNSDNLLSLGILLNGHNHFVQTIERCSYYPFLYFIQVVVHPLA